MIWHSKTLVSLFAFAAIILVGFATWRYLRARGNAVGATDSTGGRLLLVGLLLNAVLGWWWADSAAALCMVPIMVNEGLEGLRGEHCDCQSCS